MSCFGPGLHRSLQCKRPSKGQVLTTTRTASQIMFFIYRYVYEWRQIYRECWCAFTCGRFGAVNERKKGRERARENEGQVKFRADFLPAVSHCRKAKLLPDLGIHPCIVQCSYPSHLLVVIPLSSHSFFHLYFGFILASDLFSFFVFILALRWSVLLRGMAQGDNVCREAVFE